MSSPILKLENVSKSFIVSSGFTGNKQHLLAVDTVNLELHPSRSLGLVGESGCGKSTLGKLACGLLQPDSGKVFFDKKNLPPVSSKSWAAGKIQMVFQDPASSLNPRLSVLSSIMEPLVAQGIKKKQALEKAKELIGIIGLAGQENKYPHQFSGGQKQRIAITRAIITHPQIIVCDEPVSALDASVQAQILNLFKDMQRQYKPAYLFISHDLAVVGFMCERINVMYLGQIVEKGSREQIFTDPAHPYTEILVESIPGGAKIWKKGEDIKKLPQALAGELPSPINPPAGCRFHTRCFKARPVCSQNSPPWKIIQPGHETRCFFPITEK